MWMITFDKGDWSENDFGEFTTKENALKFIKEKGSKVIEEMFKDYILEDFEDFEEEPYEIVLFVGELIPFIPNIDADSVLESIAEDAYNHGGDYAEGYLDYIGKDAYSELDDRLNEVLSDWINKNNLHPNFYSVERIEEVII